MSDMRHQFSRDFKLEAVRMVTEGGQTIAEAAGSNNLRRWGKYVLRSDPMEGKTSCVFGNDR